MFHMVMTSLAPAAVFVSLPLGAPPRPDGSSGPLWHHGDERVRESGTTHAFDMVETADGPKHTRTHIEALPDTAREPVASLDGRFRNRSSRLRQRSWA